MNDLITILIGVGFVLTGAIFIGLPLGYILGQRSILRSNAAEPIPVRAARRRLWDRNILNAEVIE